MHSRAACVAYLLFLGVAGCGGPDSNQPMTTGGADTGNGSMAEAGSTGAGAGRCLAPSQFDYVMKPRAFDQRISGGAILTSVAGDARDIFFIAEALYSVPTAGGEPTLRYPSRNVSYWVRDDDVVIQDNKELFTIPREGNKMHKLPPLAAGASAGVPVDTRMLFQYRDNVRNEGSIGDKESDYHHVARYSLRDINSGDETLLFETNDDSSASHRFALWDGTAYVAAGPDDAPHQVHALPLDGSKVTELKLDAKFTELEVLDATNGQLLLFGREDGKDRSLYRLSSDGGVFEEIEHGSSVARMSGWYTPAHRGPGGVALETLGNEIYWVADGSSEATLVTCFDSQIAHGVVSAENFLYTNVFFDFPNSGHNGENGLIRVAMPQ